MGLYKIETGTHIERMAYRLFQESAMPATASITYHPLPPVQLASIWTATRDLMAATAAAAGFASVMWILLAGPGLLG